MLDIYFYKRYHISMSLPVYRKERIPMTFETLGDPKNTPVMLIHGMLCTSDECIPFGRYLSQRYYVIMPTLDGHGSDGTDLVSAEQETEKISAYLKANGIDRLALLQGSSMGAEIALAVKAELDKNGIAVDSCFFDGGPFFRFVPPFRAFMYRVFSGLVKVFDTDDPSSAAGNMKKHPMFRFIAKGKAEQYEQMIAAMTKERRSFSDKTIHGMVDICYNCTLPDLPEETQRTFTFFFAKTEPARKSMKRLMKTYPKARYRTIDGYSHCGFQMTHPREYASMLEQTIISPESR